MLNTAQSMNAFDEALAALRRAGVELVHMDMSLVIDLAAVELPDLLFSTFETPRELSR